MTVTAPSSSGSVSIIGASRPGRKILVCLPGQALKVERRDMHEEGQATDKPDSPRVVAAKGSVPSPHLLGDLALRASQASHAGESLKVTPDEFLALQYAADHWEDVDPAVQDVWRAVLRDRHPCLSLGPWDPPPALNGLPVEIVIPRDTPPDVYPWPGLETE